jgi:predicted GH43/DUF377 family glycosyl hydrolase
MMGLLKFFMSLIISIVLFPSCTDGSSPEEFSWTRDLLNPFVSGIGQITDISDPTVLFDNNKYRMWGSCIQEEPGLEKEDWPAYIFYSESDDGTAWSDPVIVFSPSFGGWDNRKVEVPSVIKDDEENDPQRRYKLWYGGASDAEPDLTKIGFACSPDGINWTRLPRNESPYSQDGLVLIPENVSPGDMGVVSDPTVLIVNNAYYMWYNSFGEEELVICFAVSDDGIHWTKSEANPVLHGTPGTWEGEGPSGPDGFPCNVVHPSVSYNSDTGLFTMWYGSFSDTGLLYTGIGSAESLDGVTWSKSSHNPLLVPEKNASGEELGLVPAPCVIESDGIFHLYYGGYDKSGTMKINHAFRPKNQD